jgi:DNA-binding MarR family transcriptional regulator
MRGMARQPSKAASRQLAVALHDLAWLLPRTLDSAAEAELESLPQSELEVMRLLVRRPALSVGEVARELGLQLSNASATVRALTGRGLLERRPDERDGRITRLVPTQRAVEIRQAREEAWGRLLRATLGELPTDEVVKLVDAAPALRSLAWRLAR